MDMTPRGTTSMSNQQRLIAALQVAMSRVGEQALTMTN